MTAIATAIGIGSVFLLAANPALAQAGHMMGGGWGYGWMGGYGGFWMPVVLVLVIGLVIWVIKRK